MLRFLTVVLFLTGFVSYAQPVVSDEIYLADPAILRVGKTYYLYGTVEENADQGFKVYVSSDQKHWEDKGFAMKKFQSYGEKGFWAPQVLRYQDKLIMAYVANERIAIARSESPLGPFRQEILQPLETGVKQIDPFIFVDEDGKVYLYHVRLQNGNRLFVGEMKKDLSGMIAETVKECLNASEDWENTAKAGWPVAEGPTVLKHKGIYYLFYTANDFRNPDYAVGEPEHSQRLGHTQNQQSGRRLGRVRADSGEAGEDHRERTGEADEGRDDACTHWLRVAANGFRFGGICGVRHGQ